MRLTPFSIKIQDKFPGLDLKIRVTDDTPYDGGSCVSVSYIGFDCAVQLGAQTGEPPRAIRRALVRVWVTAGLPVLSDNRPHYESVIGVPMRALVEKLNRAAYELGYITQDEYEESMRRD